MWIPEHKELTAERRRSLLTTTQGKAFDSVYFGAWFADAIDEAKLPDDCVLHGSRKTAARKLAEAGCPPTRSSPGRRHFEARDEHRMNPDCQTRLQNSAKQRRPQPKS